MTDLRIYRNLGPVTICISRRNTWIGYNHWLVGAIDHKVWPPLFSERYDRYPARHYHHIGRWCLHYDTNWMNRRTREITV